MTTATESVLAPFAGEMERWSGNIAPDDSAFRVDGAFIFRLDGAVERRGTHARHGFRETTEAAIEREWKRIVEQATVEWAGGWHGVDYAVIDGVCLKSGGVKAYADRKYLALANRLLAPDRVTFSPAGGYKTKTLADGTRVARAPSIVFHRDGEPVGALAQLRPPK